MISAEKSRFDTAAEMLGEIGIELKKLPSATKNRVTEIRLRAGRPVMLELENTRVKAGERVVTTKDVSDCITRFCGYSVYSHEKELSEGYITIKGGHRAGFCGSNVVKHGKTETIGGYSSINLRISREHIGCADRLCRLIREEKDFKGLLIIGPPLTAKTTILRDLARQLGNISKVTVIDERGEIAACCGGVPQNDVGINTDVLSGFRKSEAISMALRAMSPEYIICDEIGRENEEIENCVNSGVKLVITAHCGSVSEAYKSCILKPILETGAISHIALMSRDKLGEIKSITATDGYNENSDNDYSADYKHRNRSLSFLKA